MGALDNGHPTHPTDQTHHTKPEPDHAARTTLQDFVAQHLASNKRNTGDAHTDRQAMANDRGGNNTAQAIINLDHHMQQELAHGKQPSKAEIEQSARLHAASKGFTKVDAKMDNDAINQDPADANGERRAIASDQAALKLRGLSPSTKHLIEQDLRQKRGLLANETGDTSDEQRYLNHDGTADRAGDRLAAALQSHNPQAIKAALAADTAAQRTKGADYRADKSAERGYVSADELNNHQNALLARALATDPYAHLQLRGK